MRSFARAGGTSVGDRREEGAVLVWALFFMSVTTGLLLSHSFEMDANRRDMDVRYRQVEHARAFARSGLTETTAWLRRQTVQPVTTFEPKLDLEGSPKVNDTLDPKLGLVREFEVRGSLWGRYEVRKAEVADMSPSRALPAGSLWDVCARGLLFERLDPTKRFDQYPNRVVAIHSLRTQIQGIKVTLPAQSAVVIPDASRLVIHPGVTVQGGSAAAVAFRAAPPANVLSALLDAATSPLTGQPKTLQVANLTTGSEAMFSLRSERVARLAERKVHDKKWKKRRPLEEELVFAGGELVVTPLAPITGTGVVIIEGDFDVQPDTSSDLAGMIVVHGDARIRGPFRLRGSLIVAGGLELGDGARPVVITYDERALARVRDLLARYRQDSEVRPNGTTGVFTPLDDYVARWGVTHSTTAPVAPR